MYYIICSLPTRLTSDTDVTIPDYLPDDSIELFTNEPKLKYVSTRLNWQYAEAFCKIQGGHLASAASSYQWQRLQLFMKGEGITERESVWLGRTLKLGLE